MVKKNSFDDRPLGRPETQFKENIFKRLLRVLLNLIGLLGLYLCLFIGSIGVSFYKAALNYPVEAFESLESLIGDLIGILIIAEIGITLIVFWFSTIFILKYIFRFGKVWRRNRIFSIIGLFTVSLNWFYVAYPLLEILLYEAIDFKEQFTILLSFLPLFMITIFFIQAWSPEHFHHLDKLEYIDKAQFLINRL